MIHSPRFSAVLDACVLYPAPVRDILLNLAEQELLKPKWTEEIHDEWMKNLLRNRKDLKRKQLEATVEAMNSAFPDSLVENYSSLVSTLSLPDPKDRHILAAAIRCKADLIVTYNTNDFPYEQLTLFDIDVQHPDVFISNLIDLNHEKAIKAFQNQVRKLKNPPMTTPEVLESLRKCGLEQSIEKFKIA